MLAFYPDGRGLSRRFRSGPSLAKPDATRVWSHAYIVFCTRFRNLQSNQIAEHAITTYLIRFQYNGELVRSIGAGFESIKQRRRKTVLDDM